MVPTNGWLPIRLLSHQIAKPALFLHRWPPEDGEITDAEDVCHV
jgi:hypothetical protein